MNTFLLWFKHPLQSGAMLPNSIEFDLFSYGTIPYIGNQLKTVRFAWDFRIGEDKIENYRFYKEGIVEIHKDKNIINLRVCDIVDYILQPINHDRFIIKPKENPHYSLLTHNLIFDIDTRIILKNIPEVKIPTSHKQNSSGEVLPLTFHIEFAGQYTLHL